MNICRDFISMVGNTPLLLLRRASEETGCMILGKAEFMNPGGSVKDRAACGIILDAEEKKQIGENALIVEGTAGNTGIGLSLVGRSRGYRSLIVIPETQSDEKKDMLRICGAELIEVPALPYKDPNHYVHYAARLAEERAKTDPYGAIWANQFDNIANYHVHMQQTSREIWDQTEGKIDAFSCAVGTGGTLCGVALGLKERNRDIRIGLSDPMGAALYSYYTKGVLESEGSSITEGIGQGRITANIEKAPIDHAWQITDQEALDIIFNLLHEEGLCLGLSSGINIAGAKRMAAELGKGKVIVTILCDSGHRYTSRLFNPDFLDKKGLQTPSWLQAVR